MLVERDALKLTGAQIGDKLLIEMADGKQVWTFKLRQGVKFQIFSMAHRPDGKMLALGGYKEVRLVEAGTGRVLEAVGNGGPARGRPGLDRVAGAGVHARGQVVSFTVPEAIDPVRVITNSSSGKMGFAMARTARRLGAKNVRLAYRRTRAEMPADTEEVEQAEDEGIHLALLTIPKAVVGRDGRLTGLQCIRAQLIKREDSERLFPVPVEGSGGGADRAEQIGADDQGPVDES